MAIKYHISKKTQKPGVCKAEVRDCPLGERAPHFATKTEAEAHIEAELSKEFDTTPKIKKFSAKQFMWNEETNKVKTLELYQENRELHSKLTKQERNVLSFYTLTGSSETNRHLHGVRKDHDSPVESIERDIAIMDSIFERFEERKPRQLFRYLVVPQGMTQAEFADSLGSKETYEDDGYMSTTEDIAFIRAYAHKWPKKKFVVLSIETDRGLSMQSYKEEQMGTLQSFEKERVIPRGMKFHVVNSIKANLETPLERETMLRQFAGSYWRDWEEGKDPVGRIRPKSFPIIELKSIGD